MNKIFVILHDIRSVHNVGSAFRTSDAAGVDKIYLTGYSPLPIDRFGRKRSDVAKVALGAEESIPWEHYDNIEDLIEVLKDEGVHITAVEQSKNSIGYKEFENKEQTAFIFGNEVDGIPESVLKQCDSVVEIPMKGEKESLNVSVAVGVILFSK